MEKSVAFRIFTRMETIPKVDCVKIGTVQKTHGINGEVVIRFSGEYYDTVEQALVLFLEIDGLLVPFFVAEDGLRFRSGETVITKFDWIDTDQKAAELVGLSVFVKNEDIVLPEDEFHTNRLVGFTLFDTKLGQIGPVVEVNDYSGNLIITVDYSGREVLVPLNEDFLVRLDEETKMIELDTPGGIFNLDELEEE